MAVITARLLKRGLQLFALVSLLGVVGLLIYSNAWRSTLEAVTRLHLGWALVMLALASLDWFGGGLRLWLLTKRVHRATPFMPMVLSAGLNAWGALLTPSQTGGGPIQIFVMKRAGVPIPESTTSSLMSFVATVAFFAIVGPVAIVFGAGRSLERHGIPLVNLSFLDLFRASAGVFAAIGALMLFIMMAPGLTARLFHAVIGWLERHRGEKMAKRVDVLRSGVDRMQDCMVAYIRTPLGLAATLGGVITSALAHANKLLAGWVVLRALGIHANLTDVLVVQTTIVFLLYFAPTPGASGIAEALSAALMSVYVPRDLLPAYTLLWRFTVSYATVGVGSYVFYRFLSGQLDRANAAAAAPEPA